MVRGFRRLFPTLFRSGRESRGTDRPVSPKTQNPKPQTQNPKPKTPKPIQGPSKDQSYTLYQYNLVWIFTSMVEWCSVCLTMFASLRWPGLPVNRTAARRLPARDQIKRAEALQTTPNTGVPRLGYHIGVLVLGAPPPPIFVNLPQRPNLNN